MKKKLKKYIQPASEEPVSTLLQDQQLERGLLCSLLNDTGAFARVRAFRQFLREEDFTGEDNRATWQLMLACVDEGQEVNMLNVYAQSASRGRQWDMSRYIQLNGSEGDSNTMAVTLASMGIKRRLCEDLKTIVMDIEYNTELSPEQLLSDVEKMLDATSRTVKPKTLRWQSVFSLILSDYEKIATGQVITGNKCGFSLIDGKGGFELGELMVIGARTSNGKTAFSLNCAVNIAQAGVPVGIFSLEMTNKQLGTRIVSILTGVDSSQVKQGQLEPADVDRMTSVDDKLPIYFDDVRSSDIDVIINNIKGMVLTHGVQVVVLDYLQLMRSRERDRFHQVGSICHRLEALSKQLEITIVLISQLRRNVDKDPCPRLEELKESGDIADAADSIYLLYRPEQHGEYFRYPQLSKDWSNVDIHGTAMLMCVKNRQGEKAGEEILGFEAKCTRFYEPAYLKSYSGVEQSKTDVEKKLPF